MAGEKGLGPEFALGRSEGGKSEEGFLGSSDEPRVWTDQMISWSLNASRASLEHGFIRKSSKAVWRHGA